MVLIVLYFCSNSALGQRIILKEKKQILAALWSTRSDILHVALDKIEEMAQEGQLLAEAIPVLEQNIWKQIPYLQYRFVRAMWKLRSPNTLMFAQAFMDSANTFHEHYYRADPLHMKVRASQILFDLGDFSIAPLVFQLLERDKPYVDPFARNVLAPIARNVPSLADKARAYLINIALTNESPRNRSLSMDDLITLYGLEVSDVLIQAARNDSVGVNRNFALNSLIKLNYPQSQNLLYERLSAEPEWTFRIGIAETLLVRYGSPQDYHRVQNHLSAEPYPTARNLIARALRLFRPPNPSATMSISVLLDTLVSYKHQVAALGWLGDKNFVKELDNHLDNAKRHLTRRDSLNTAQQVRLFQEKVHREHERTKQKQQRGVPRDPRFVTIEAWKFLYHHAGYILQRLPRERKPK